MLTRALPLLFVAAMAVSAGGQPPMVPPARPDTLPTYTAFPDLKPAAEGKTLELPPLPTEPADATPLQKVRFAQLREGVAYVELTRRAWAITGPRAEDLDENFRVTAAVCRSGAELETDPARKVTWLETRVRLLKEHEQYTRRRAEAGSVGPTRPPLAAFARLEAEADLLKLKAELKK